ncbi:hypothetical protein JF544_05615 [Halobacillus kuroshimensis]|uniref:Uncharacterized protein n=1 Tax=Halobacillus kuroshimensis TaxID=302481 RepID=A0ABS3DTS7_9BACI|nr:hypothetical protein [Halobacillus kuroshimensis]MBN8234715.1 hypothetical protein [Halobacillus kuroshimensis]
MSKLNKAEMLELKNNYFKKLDRGIELEKILWFIEQDVVDTGQVNKLQKDIVKEIKEREYREKVKFYEDVNEALDSPEKWIMRGHAIVKAYPHPVLRGINVVGIEYKTTPFLFPDELWELYCEIEVELSIHIPEWKANRAIDFMMLREQGYKDSQIARMYNLNPSVVTNNIAQLEEDRVKVSKKDLEWYKQFYLFVHKKAL